MVVAEVVAQFMDMNVILLFIGFVIFIIIAYKIFRVIMKALIFGLLGAAFPVAVNFLGADSLFGISVALSLENIVFFAMIGIVVFIVYYLISGMMKVTNFVTSPFRGGHKKDIRKELKKELEKREKEQEKEKEKEKAKH